jgi:hypothetical protein
MLFVAARLNVEGRGYSSHLKNCLLKKPLLVRIGLVGPFQTEYNAPPEG